MRVDVKRHEQRDTHKRKVHTKQKKAKKMSSNIIRKKTDKKDCEVFVLPATRRCCCLSERFFWQSVAVLVDRVLKFQVFFSFTYHRLTSKATDPRLPEFVR